ncbi:hypothetical protein AOR11_23680 [Vibrio alginolyticus]|uniref:hypothetical protein n=1 Tax=Vibrio alginolyticus TaxID=663 RepID=UPI0006CA715C|nr:hypothetical protein [Vibrio alginolyticus]KPM98323.1 hypothetical protein AOR11_23680 [Vibrio alginolyticus]
MEDWYTYFTKYKDFISVGISFLALIFSWISMSRSKRNQLKQLELEAKSAKLADKELQRLNDLEINAPALFFTEINGHLAQLTRTLDFINPLWMRRGEDDFFSDKEVSHANLNITTFEKSIEQIIDFDLKVALQHYYQEVLVFNSRGMELLNSEIKDELTLKYFVRGAATLIRTAIYLSDELLKSMDSNVRMKERIDLMVDDLLYSRAYKLTVANTSDLNITDLRKLYYSIREDGEESIDSKKYPVPKYLFHLYLSVKET